jgi:hypothetical protein
MHRKLNNIIKWNLKLRQNALLGEIEPSHLIFEKDPYLSKVTNPVQCMDYP